MRVCGTIIRLPNSQKNADRAFTRFKGIIQFFIPADNTLMESSAQCPEEQKFAYSIPD